MAQTEYARLEGGKCVYRIHRSPMCEYMINFIHKLKHLPEKYMMNSVLENFTILQVTIVKFHQNVKGIMSCNIGFPAENEMKGLRPRNTSPL